MKYFILSLVILITSCNGEDSQPKDLRSYWWMGKAEISSYTLTQSRYGRYYPGTLVHVIVPEPFDSIKGVKWERDDFGPGRSEALKLNASRRFQTGLYPYTIMTSVFIDFSNAKAYKLSFSAQEWCGHVWHQLIAEQNQWKEELHSYFQSEGELKRTLKYVLPEEALMLSMRLGPQKFISGRHTMLPSLLESRFSHTQLAPVSALITSDLSGRDWIVTVEMPEVKRKLIWISQKEFPWKLLEFEESSASYPSGEIMTTRGKLKKTLRIDYWNRNKNGDEELLEQLNIQQLK